MASIKDLFQTADWKSEKHVPVIEAEPKVKKGESLKITVSVGKEIAHPNTTEHHIAWIELYFLPKGEKLPYQLGRFEFSAHGSSVQGPNTSTVYTQSVASCVVKTEKSGTIFASSYCNIHGLWESSQDLTVE
ncbi:MAG: class II SORL domain-containing protein [Candidatus Omnitrophica bacterium]|nr:class II SORL domain-containing protein [Candidatus Omnitrophota bacterium]